MERSGEAQAVSDFLDGILKTTEGPEKLEALEEALSRCLKDPALNLIHVLQEACPSA